MVGIIVGALVACAAVSAAGQQDERLYGRVTTRDGEVVEGYLRWDRNEASRADFLDGAKVLSREVLDEAERLDPAFAEEMRQRRSIVAFGVRIRWDEDDLEGPLTVPSAVRFAHLASLEPLEGGGARITLGDGEVLELRGSTTDVGPGMRGLLVDTGSGADVEIDWRDLRRVDFLARPDGVPEPRGATLHGTVRTWGGLELTGWIAWDRDEVLDSDVLDGHEGADDLAIPFRDIASIAPEGRRSASVTLGTGEVLSLRGTNDVDRGNRGVEVSGPSWGRAIVSWEDLEVARFHAPGTRAAESWEGLGPIRGTVWARDGRVLTGEIRWGLDEERAWELLDGWHGDTRVELELGAIEQVRPDGSDAAVVSLRDGRVLRLEDTDDVGEGHRGLFVKPDGGARRLVRWQDVDRVIFVR